MRHFEERVYWFESSGEEYDAGIIRRTSFQRKKTTHLKKIDVKVHQMG